MKIFVLGAGRMGSVVAMDLVHGKAGIEVGIGDIDFKRAQSVASALGNAKAFKVDIAKTDELANTLHGFDSVVNASWFEYNLRVMRACIKAGCEYNDLGGLFHMTRKQMELDSEAKKAGISAIVGGGESPGITNVMCALASEDFSQIDSIKVLCGAKEELGQNSNEVYFPFSVSTVIDEYSKNPVEYINGKFVEMPPLSGDEIVHFPTPVGENVCHYSLHSEPATLPATIGKGIRNVEFKLGISEKMTKSLRPLIELGLTSEEKISFNGHEISPKQFLVKFFDAKAPSGEEPIRTVALRTIVSGVSKDEEATVILDVVCGPVPEMGINNATAFMTGTAGSIFGQFLAEDKVKEKGVLAPEQAVDTREFFAELGRRGILLNRTLDAK